MDRTEYSGGRRMLAADGLPTVDMLEQIEALPRMFVAPARNVPADLACATCSQAEIYLAVADRVDVRTAELVFHLGKGLLARR